ncbi:hypothetical protein S40288_10925 [Stachybotrys chartarum IBT 40288]|nr:hypothetical protein S40288_10925 [Stachybotrys chartarum IBT 40288]
MLRFRGGVGVLEEKVRAIQPEGEGDLCPETPPADDEGSTNHNTMIPCPSQQTAAGTGIPERLKWRWLTWDTVPWHREHARPTPPPLDGLMRGARHWAGSGNKWKTQRLDPSPRVCLATSYEASTWSTIPYRFVRWRAVDNATGGHFRLTPAAWLGCCDGVIVAAVVVAAVAVGCVCATLQQDARCHAVGTTTDMDKSRQAVTAAAYARSRNSKTLCGPPDESVGSVYPVLRTDPTLGHSSTAFPGIERICLALIGVASVWTGTWPLRTAPKKCDEVKSGRQRRLPTTTATTGNDDEDGQRRRRSLILGYEADARTENACDEERGSHSIRLELASLTLASRATYCGLTPPVTLYNGDAAWIGSGLKSQSCVRIAA